MTDMAEKLAGKFLVIDGPDGAGKTTQARLLGEYLRSLGVLLCPVRDPGGTLIGDRIRSILLDRRHAEMAVECELMLYMASRAQLVAEVIQPALASGQCVLADRFVSSTIAYQGAGGIDVEAIRSVVRVAVRDLWPDLTVILDLPAEVGLERVRHKNAMAAELFDRMESKAIDFHRRVRSVFLQQARGEAGRFAVLDATPGMEEVQQRLRDVVEGWKWR